MPDDPSEPNQHDLDDSFERRLRAIVSDAGADAPGPPDFRSTVMSEPSAAAPRTDRRRIAAIGAGALALAAALAAFFLVPRGDDDALVVSDSTAVELPTSSTDPATTVTAAETTPSTSEPSADVVVTSDAPVTTSTPGTVAPITTTPPPPTEPATTTEPAATTTTTSEPAMPLPPVTGIDLAGQEVFGYQLFAIVDVDDVRSDIAMQLGEPTLDSDWQAFAGDCTGSTAYRVLWWGDLRMTFERYDRDGAAVDGFEAWSVGDPTVLSLAPIGDVPAVAEPSGVVTNTGLGVGSTRADVIAVADNTFADGDSMTVLLGGQASRFRFDADDRVTGFGGGAFDCPTPGDEDR